MGTTNTSIIHNPGSNSPRKILLLYKISDILSAEDDIHKALYRVLRQMNETMGMLRGMISIFNRRTNQIFVEEAYGLTDVEKERGKYSLGEGITGKVVESGEPAIVRAVGDDPDFLDKTQSRNAMEKKDISYICVPIRWYREVIGTISADRQFGAHLPLEEDVKLLTIIASMVSQKVSLHRAVHEENQSLLDENVRLQGELKEKYRPSNIIGNSKSMRVAYDLVAKVAPAQTSVLLLGESGVGKELFAHAIHYRSLRHNKPFIKVNCSALPPNLIESELFGHQKGAFTGAVNTRKGRFELAEGGTIFLDEIGELGLDTQTKLLRVLQEREYERVGCATPMRADVRIIAATNRDLAQRIKEGQFREDLFYRLNVFPITIPPLRERKTDIPLLLDYFIEKYSHYMDKQISRISTPAIDMAVSYHWPGNVRELENCIERAVIMCEGDVIRSQHLPPTLQTVRAQDAKPRGTLQAQIDAIEYEIIMEELKRCKGNMSRAAEALGLTKRIMGLRVKKYGIEIKNYKHVGRQEATSPNLIVTV